MLAAFEWDENKTNIEKLGVSFETACRIVEGSILTVVDNRFDYGEIRENTIGRIEEAVVPVVTHTDCHGVTRIISVRPAECAERDRHEQALRQGMTIEELAALPDDAIDTSDVPPLDETFWQNAKLVEPDPTQQITLRVKKSVLDAYKATGKGYQTRM